LSKYQIGIHSFTLEHAKPLFFLVGNKTDVREGRVGDGTIAKELAKKLGCRYVEVSAKTSEGIKEFGQMVRESVREYYMKVMVGVSRAKLVEVGKSEEEESECCEEDWIEREKMRKNGRDE
jgi:50S ribosomal subunit-associated GTPase HflX